MYGRLFCGIVRLLSVCIIMSIGRWSEFSEAYMVVMSGDVCWCALFGTLVGVSVLSVI